ncbi:MAG: hypothetical protein RL648_536 [Verrucomicrobiota bacterium]
MTTPKQNFLPESAPFSGDRRLRVEALLGELSRDEQIWLSGYLAAAGMSGAAVAAEVKPTMVLYGSESGNAEGCAAGLSAAIKAKGWPVRLVNMADCMVKDLSREKRVLVVVSTWGEGDPPEPATRFFTELCADSAPRLEGLEFAVFGLGDSSYADFCECGKVVDRRLEALGAKRLLPRVDADVDYEGPFDAWKAAVLEMLEPSVGGAVVEVTEPIVTAKPAIEYGKKRPFPAAVKALVRLSGRGSAKNTCHLELSLEGSGMAYKPGDVLGVLPRNSPAMVEEMLALVGLSGEEPVAVGEEQLPLQAALESKFDITALGLPIVKKVAELTANADLLAELEEPALAGFKEWMKGRELRDLLQRFPVRGVTAEAFVGILRKMPPRLYSIASSLRSHPGEVHLTVGAVYYETHGRRREGVCSTYLCDRIREGGVVDVYTHANKNFFLPEDPGTPIIMVGPGTGIAPFRAFVEERAATGAKGRNWLFFGEQHFNEDFLYQLEWQDYLKSGVLTRMDVAFSRDTDQKIYVQHRMLEKAADLYAWLQEGAYFYVCGDAARMAKDVHEALLQIHREQGGLSEAQAEEAISALQKAKRYQKDVY